jgi:cardiolipin synthase
VKIHEFTGGLLHAKTITVDRSLALVTTANLDRRSFELNYEVSLVVYDSDFASRLRSLQNGYLDLSREVDALAWSRRGWARKIAQNAAGVFAPIL